MKKLFLISSSYYNGGQLWDHCIEALGKFMGKPEESHNIILFIPYAKADGDYDGYTKLISEPFKKFGYEVIGVHTYDSPEDCFYDERVCAICIGGGNTWLLQDKLLKLNFLSAISEKVLPGKWKYISASAGTMEACPSMLTTNDMAPVLPQSSEAIGLIPFQINPHYVPGPLVDKHMGETREERIKQVIFNNPTWTVVGLPEACWIEGKGDEYVLRGTNSGRIFRKKNEDNFIWSPGVPFSMLEPLW